MHWKDYEKEIFEYFKTHYPEALITFDAKLKGRYSKRDRQIDVLIEDSIADFPVRLVVDAKYYARRIDVKHVEQFIAMVEDVDAHQGLLITSEGFSEAAINRAYYGPSRIELDIISFADIQRNQSLLAFPFSGNRSVMTFAPIGWVIEPGNSVDFLASLYQRGLTLEKAQKIHEWMYVNTWHIDSTIENIEDLMRMQSANFEKFYGRTTIEEKTGPPRKDGYRTKVRIATFEKAPFIEVTGYIQAENIIVFFVLYTRKELLTKNYRKLGFLLKYSVPANLTFDNSIVIEQALREIPSISDHEKKAEKLRQVAVWHCEMGNDALGLEFHRLSFETFANNFTNIKALVNGELRHGTTDAAASVAKALFRLQPKNPATGETIADIYIKADKGLDAVAIFRELINEFADQKEELGNLYFHLANLLHWLQTDPKKVILTMQKAEKNLREVFPDSHEVFGGIQAFYEYYDQKNNQS